MYHGSGEEDFSARLCAKQVCLFVSSDSESFAMVFEEIERFVFSTAMKPNVHTKVFSEPPPCNYETPVSCPLPPPSLSRMSCLPSDPIV